jgi:hypothetical protein
MSLLKKTAVGRWVNREGFAGAIMLNWNMPDKDGVRHYRFLASPFDVFPHDIVENGVDDAVLITNDMLSSLISRGAARPMTDEEAEAANKNYDLVEAANEENVVRQQQIEEQNKVEREKPITKVDPSVPVQPTILKSPPVQESLETSAQESRAPAKADAKSGKKGT